MVKQMLLRTCSSLTMLSTVTSVIVPSMPKLVNHLPNILHFTLITVQKVGKTCFITIRSVIYYVSLWSHSTLLCLIAGWGSNKMHLGEHYQDFLKWGGVMFLGHSLIIIKWTWGFFPKNLQFNPLLQLGTKEYW